MHRTTSAILGLAALVSASAAGAADRPLDVAFNFGAATDYVFRGMTQTGGRPQAFAGADLGLGKLGYAGVWASNVRFAGENGVEYDLYGGVRPSLGPVALDFGVVRYGYASLNPAGPRDFTEFKAAASLPLGPATFGGAIYHSPDFYGRLGQSNYFEVNAASQLPGGKFSLSGAVGRQQISRAQDYSTWNLGVGYAAGEHLGFDLRYFDTGRHSLGSDFGSRLVLGLKSTF
jgi:uncharacterized protein (TIGR02001 family)